jgi:hypothetical protein
MASKNQLTGMRGVYLVASELSKLGFTTSTTSRSAIGADILVTDQSLKKTFSVQVKTNARAFGFWLLNPKAKTQVSNTHIYVLVNIKKREETEKIEYYIIPSVVVAKKMCYSKKKSWPNIRLKDAQKYRDNWPLFMKS